MVISVQLPESGVCIHIIVYVHVNCFLVRGCAVSMRCIDFCNNDVCNVVNMYLAHLKFCVVCINGLRYVCCSEIMFSLTSVMSPPLVLVVKLCTLGVFALGVSLVSWIVMISACVLWISSLSSSRSFFKIPFMLTWSIMRFISLLLLVRWGCPGRLCGGCVGCGDCDACAVVCVGCEYAERVRGC